MKKYDMVLNTDTEFFNCETLESRIVEAEDVILKSHESGITAFFMVKDVCIYAETQIKSIWEVKNEEK